MTNHQRETRLLVPINAPRPGDAVLAFFGIAGLAAAGFACAPARHFLALVGGRAGAARLSPWPPTAASGLATTHLAGGRRDQLSNGCDPVWVANEESPGRTGRSLGPLLAFTSSEQHRDRQRQNVGQPTHAAYSKDNVGDAELSRLGSES
jgi:hypothetical protein